jgi:hypothetical protein
MLEFDTADAGGKPGDRRSLLDEEIDIQLESAYIARLTESLGIAQCTSSGFPAHLP